MSELVEQFNQSVDSLSREQLARIRDMASNQIRLIDMAEAFKLVKGDRVKARSDVRPKYLAGATGTVEEFDGDRISVKMDSTNDYRVTRRGSVWGMTFGSLEKLEG